ncbi:MAG: hypothetical protein ACREH8_09675 [Opitutaceae bacterium]
MKRFVMMEAAPARRTEFAIAATASSGAQPAAFSVVFLPLMRIHQGMNQYRSGSITSATIFILFLFALYLRSRGT